METYLQQWEAALQTDEALQDRLKRLNPDGYAATKRGDLVALKIKKEAKAVVVSWNGTQIQVERRQAKNPFLAWTIDRKQFTSLFLSGKTPPVLVAMNNDQKNIQAGCDHHNGALALSCMVMLQEVTEGGGGK